MISLAIALPSQTAFGRATTDEARAARAAIKDEMWRRADPLQSLMDHRSILPPKSLSGRRSSRMLWASFLLLPFLILTFFFQQTKVHNPEITKYQQLQVSSPSWDPHLKNVGSVSEMDHVRLRRLMELHRWTENASYGSLQENTYNTKAPYLFFTHLRRTGGSAIENEVFKLAIGKSSGRRFLRKKKKRVLQQGWRVPHEIPGRMLNCYEGYHARFYEFDYPRRRNLVYLLGVSEMQWRHCPYGLHQFLAPGRPYMYFTMLRAPAARMHSWRRLATTAGKQVFKGTTEEYFTWRASMVRRNITTKAFPIPHWEDPEIQHPNQLDYRLDDNYQVRMICGPPAHNATEVTEEHLRCAMHNLLMHYGVVGVRERFDETVCLLAVALGRDPAEAIWAARKNQDNPQGYTDQPEEVLAPRTSVLEYLTRFDRVLHRFATALLDLHIQYLAPQCRCPDELVTHAEQALSAAALSEARAKAQLQTQEEPSSGAPEIEGGVEGSEGDETSPVASERAKTSIMEEFTRPIVRPSYRAEESSVGMDSPEAKRRAEACRKSPSDANIKVFLSEFRRYFDAEVGARR